MTSGNGVEEEPVVELGRALKRLNAILLRDCLVFWLRRAVVGGREMREYWECTRWMYRGDVGFRREEKASLMVKRK